MIHLHKAGNGEFKDWTRKTRGKTGRYVRLKYTPENIKVETL